LILCSALLVFVTIKTLVMQPKKLVSFSLLAEEFSWDIAPGKSIPAWGFNQQVPGPVLRANKGDTLMVHLTNNLMEPTTIHWHGIRLTPSMDGTDDVQQPVAPGETFVYEFELPDAGTFWYHSHINETVQMERGLYGALIVEDKDDPLMDGEQVLVLDDLKLTSSNDFEKGNFLTRWIERHDGREGTIALVNGKEQPVLHISAGQQERWRIVNAASARYFLLHMQGKSFQIIATDGGLIENPLAAQEILLTPGERVDVVVGPFNEGEEFSLLTQPYNRTTIRKSKAQKLATIAVGPAKPSRAVLPERLRSIEVLAPQEAPPTRTVKFSVGPSLKHGIDFLVNDNLHAHDAPVRVGELQVWEVQNTSLMDHPFHLHGFFFQVLEVNGKAPAFRAWKDTVNLPPRSSVKIAWLPDNRPGQWMYHCHILEHHAAGMMAHFEVVDETASTPGVQPYNYGHHQHE
jgi:FtsP/CotA-like multicopper oxidase with cupredoxin domain